MNWDRVKNRIVPKLINMNWNEHLLKERPYTPVPCSGVSEEKAFVAAMFMSFADNNMAKRG